MPSSNLPEIIAGTAAVALTALSVGLASPAATGASPSSAAAAPSSSAAPSATPSVAPASPMPGSLQVYFGNLHSHTSYSDGSGTPAEAFEHARNEAHLDFMAITDHNHAAAEQGAGDRRDGVLLATSPELYDGPSPGSIMNAANAATVDGKFVALYGQEFSTISSGNHANVFDVRGVIDVPNGDFRALVESWLPAHPDTTGTAQLIQFNHPKSPRDATEYGADDFGSQAEWVKAMDAHAELIEVFNGPGTHDGSDLTPEKFPNQYLDYLSLGFHLSPTGDQDNHYRTWGTLTQVRTGVIAAALTKHDLLAALKARHTYGTSDRNLRFIARAVVAGEEHLMGDLIRPPANGTAFSIRYSLADDDEPGMAYDIDVLAGVVGSAAANVVERVHQDGNTPANGSGQIENLTYQGGRQYFLLKLTQKAEHGPDDVLWTAPVWFEEGAPGGGVSPAPALTTQPDASHFIASKNSGIYHLSSDCRFAKSIKEENRVTGAAAAQGRDLHPGCPVK